MSAQKLDGKARAEAAPAPVEEPMESGRLPVASTKVPLVVPGLTRTHTALGLVYVVHLKSL